MKRQFYIAGVLSLFVLLFAAPVAGQDNEASPPSAEAVETTAPVEPEIPAGQEVEINEDNYRQFMELKDANLQREIIPENVFKPGSGLQKLEKLPEASQKHLRNELREIIVQGDPWQPGDEQGDFPYTPSAAAASNPGLEKQEKEAWGELVDSYNQREAQIHANSAGSQAARGTEDASGANPGDNQESTGNGGQGSEGSPAQQAGQQGNPDQPDTTGTYSPNASSDPNATSTAGASQNAMEFLQGLAKGGGGTKSSGERETVGNGGPAEPSTASTAGSNSQTGQQDSTAQESADADGSPVSAQQPNATSTAGASQNAMEFLKGNYAQGQTESSAKSAQANQGQGETQAGEQGQAQADGQQDGQEVAQAEAQGDGQASSQDDGQAQDDQQTETAQTPALSVTPGDAAPVSPAETEEDSTAGASQNALEYLTGEQAQASDGESEEQAAGEPEGTLTIQDLLNAQGVGVSTGTAPAPTIPADQKQPDEGKPDKDGGSH